MGKFLLSTLLLLTTAFASTAAEKTITLTSTVLQMKGNGGKYVHTDPSSNIQFTVYGNDQNTEGNICLSKCGSSNGNWLAVTSNPQGHVITKISLSNTVKGGNNATILDVYKNNAAYKFTASKVDGSSSGIGSKVKTTSMTKTKTTYPYDINDVAFLLFNESTGGSQIKISEIVVTYEESGNEPPMPTECVAPTFTVDGKNVANNACTGYAGSIISVSQQAKGITTSWAVKVNEGEQTTIGNDVFEFTIPASAQIGDVYTFSATAEVEGKPETAKSSYVEVTIAEKKGTRTNPYSVADVIAGNTRSNEEIWVRGYIVGCVSSNQLVMGKDKLVNSNLALSDLPEGHKAGDVLDDNSAYIPVELKNKSVMRTELNLIDHPEYLGEEILICGKRDTYFSVQGLKSNTAYKLLHIAPAAPQLHESVNVSADNTISGTGTVTVLFTGLDEFTNVYYTFEPVSETNGIEAYAAEDHNHTELLYDKENGIKLDSSHIGKTLKAFACDTETGLDSAPVVYKIDITTGVAEIEAAGAGEVRWFDMQGREVKGQPEKGIYVRVANGKASKVIL